MRDDTETRPAGGLPLEIERKYLIAMPDLAALENSPNCARVDIVQTYLKTESPSESLRVRRWESEGRVLYIRTYKRKITGMTRVELEDELSREAYEALVRQADPACRPIIKRRYRLNENGFCYEIDVYPEWTDKAILEIELAREDQAVVLPEWAVLLREVTDDPRYTNHALSRLDQPWPD